MMTTGLENHVKLASPMLDHVAVCANLVATVQQPATVYSALITHRWISSVPVFVICSGLVMTALIT